MTFCIDSISSTVDKCAFFIPTLPRRNISPITKDKLTSVCKVSVATKSEVMASLFQRALVTYPSAVGTGFGSLVFANISSGDSRFEPCQKETSLQSNAVSYWLDANLEWALIRRPNSVPIPRWFWTYRQMCTGNLVTGVTTSKFLQLGGEGSRVVKFLDRAVDLCHHRHRVLRDLSLLVRVDLAEERCRMNGFEFVFGIPQWNNEMSELPNPPLPFFVTLVYSR